jgi:hypothetical protein
MYFIYLFIYLCLSLTGQEEDDLSSGCWEYRNADTILLLWRPACNRPLYSFQQWNKRLFFYGNLTKTLYILKQVNY